MYKHVYLRGNNENYLSINLSQILEQIVNGELYLWKVLWISGFGKTKDNITIMTYEDLINKSKDGIFYSWESLFDFTTKTFQIHEFLLLGDTDVQKLHRYKDEKIMRENCEFCIELVDSSYWEITTYNLSFFVNIEKNLK